METSGIKLGCKVMCLGVKLTMGRMVMVDVTCQLDAIPANGGTTLQSTISVLSALSLLPTCTMTDSDAVYVFQQGAFLFLLWTQ